MACNVIIDPIWYHPLDMYILYETMYYALGGCESTHLRCDKQILALIQPKFFHTQVIVLTK